MRVWTAYYVLNTDLNYNLVDWFKFQEYKDDKWQKTNYGYFYPDGFCSVRAENEININNGYSHAKNLKYFERELSEQELVDLEREMKLECIKALEEKKEYEMNQLQQQIDFIKKGIE